MRLLFVLLLCGSISGCAHQNLYQRFYTPNDLSSLSDKYKPVIKRSDDPTNNPRLEVVSDFVGQVEVAQSEGYVFIGHSAFYGPSIDESLAVSFGKTIGAELILLSKVSKDRITEEVPTILPIFTTTSTKYGAINSTALVSSTQTVGVDRLNYLTAFMWKLKRPSVFGTIIRDLTPEERRIYGSNKGVKVSVVLKGSPAYKADFLKDDILLKIAEKSIDSRGEFNSVTNEYAGQEVAFVVDRSGKIINGKVLLNAWSE